jgi:hypothetical protein
MVLIFLLLINVTFFFSEAFGSLKNSEFYKKPDEACNSKASSGGSSKAVRPSGTKSNPILVSPRQVKSQ